MTETLQLLYCLWKTLHLSTAFYDPVKRIDIRSPQRRQPALTQTRSQLGYPLSIWYRNNVVNIKPSRCPSRTQLKETNFFRLLHPTVYTQQHLLRQYDIIPQPQPTSWTIPRFRNRSPSRNHDGRRRNSSRLRDLDLLGRDLRRGRLINDHPLPRPIPFQDAELVIAFIRLAGIGAGPGPGPGGAVAVALDVALAAAEDGERVDLAVLPPTVAVAVAVVLLDGDADVVGHEADGEGVEEGFEERQAAGDDAVVGVDDGDKFGVPGGFGWVRGVESLDEVDDAEYGEGDGAMAC